MLSERLKHIRRECGLTQMQVAQALGIDRSTYTYYETGKTSPDVNGLKRLARIFGVSVNDLLYNDESSDVVLFSDNEPSYQSGDRAVMMGSLSKSEKQLLLLFRQLNEAGKEDLMKRAKTAVEKSIEE